MRMMNPYFVSALVWLSLAFANVGIWTPLVRLKLEPMGSGGFALHLLTLWGSVAMAASSVALMLFYAWRNARRDIYGVYACILITILAAGVHLLNVLLITWHDGGL